MAVTAAAQDRHARMIVELQDWAAANTRAIAQHREWFQQHEAWMQAHQSAMQELDRKLDRIADLILRGRGSNGQE
jgi:hypothetical protein